MTHESQAQPNCPLEARDAITLMERYMAIPAYNHAGTPTAVAVELMGTGLAKGFDDVESWFRQTDSRVHFIAVPLDFFGSQYTTSFLPVQERTDNPTHTLYAAVNGEDEAAELMKRLETTPEENLERLKTTGVLTASSSVEFGDNFSPLV